ncbi:MAG: DUF192 domain-containing protein [Thermoflexales bacterium]|nr:DUF192 domain-containing protein [Thermoflexales bacterium]
MVKNNTSGEVLLPKLKWCTSFLCRLRGLTFRRALAEDEGLLLDEKIESVVTTAIHMMFVFFPIAAIWLDGRFRVVDKALARPFGLYYAPRHSARYVLEGPPALLERVNIGDQLSISEGTL